MADHFSERLVDLKAYATGKFPKQRIAKGKIPEPNGQLDLPSVKPAWTNQGLYDYSYFMSLPEFVEGAEALMERGSREDVAIMCCEAVPWRCHRSMVCDYLAHRGVESYHVFGGRVKTHSSMLGNRLDRYEVEVVSSWPPRKHSILARSGSPPSQD